MNFEQFTVVPAEGAVDPLPSLKGSMGGLTNFSFLSKKPWTIQINLNEWVRFARPGRYRLKVTSQRVEVADAVSPSGTSPVVAISNEIELTIAAADPAWQQRTYEGAVRTLETLGPSRNAEPNEADDARDKAFETLRFLGTPEAARELARRLRPSRFGGYDSVCCLGLIGSPERSVARAALAEELADPDHAIDHMFLEAWRGVRLDDPAAETEGFEDHGKALQALVDALPNKSGDALAVSLCTALNEAWNSTPLAEETLDRLVKQAVAIFDELPVREQTFLLKGRWDKIASPALLPAIRRYAQDTDKPSRNADFDASELKRRANIAVQRWFDLDPAGARPVVLQEITRSSPRVGARELGFLKDETLPEADQALRDNLSAHPDENVASLIARYGTAAILTDVVASLDKHFGTLGCGIQSSLLAYVLRVNPESARPRLQKALAARSETHSACRRNIFGDVSAIHYDPLLEEFALQALDDPDLEVARDAVKMLGQFGSAAAEPVLWARYERWSEAVKGHEGEVDSAFFQQRPEKEAQLQMGRALAAAIATGQGWLSDEKELQLLRDRSLVPMIRREVEQFSEASTRRVVSVQCGGDGALISAGIAQYHFTSIDRLQEKLLQFPPETDLILRIVPSAGVDCLVKVRDFLRRNRLSFTEETSND